MTYQKKLIMNPLLNALRLGLEFYLFYMRLNVFGEYCHDEVH